jgi:hypothetical protein
MQYLQCPFTRENWRLLSKSALKAGESQRAYSYLHSDTLFSIESRSHPLLSVYWDWHPGMTGLRVWSINRKQVLFRSAIRSDEIDSSVLAGVCHRFPRDNIGRDLATEPSVNPGREAPVIKAHKPGDTVVLPEAWFTTVGDYPNE